MVQNSHLQLIHTALRGEQSDFAHYYDFISVDFHIISLKDQFNRLYNIGGNIYYIQHELEK